MQELSSGGKQVAAQDAALSQAASETSKNVGNAVDKFGGSNLTSQLVDTRTRTPDQIMYSLSEEKDKNGLSDRSKFKNLKNAEEAYKKTGQTLSADQTQQYNALVEKAKANQTETVSQLIKQMATGSEGERKAASDQIAKELEKVNPDAARSVREAADPDRVLREQAAKADEDQKAYEDQRINANETENERRAKARQAERMGRGSTYLSATMSRPDNKEEQDKARETLSILGVSDENITKMIEKQNETLRDRRAALEDQLALQGYSREQITAQLKDLERTKAEIEKEANAKAGQQMEKEFADAQYAKGKVTAKQFQTASGEFLPGVNEALKKDMLTAEQAAAVLSELTREQDKSIEAYRRQREAQGASNEQINEEVRLRKMGQEEAERQNRRMAMTGFTSEGVGNDILALTRSKAQGGAGLNREQAESYEKAQLTNSMVLQGFSREESGKMANALVSQGADRVTEVMNDLARTMPDSVAGMKAIMAAQMEAMKNLDRNGLKMVLGRR